MSRAYRIKVSESLTRVIRAEDHVGTQLELLEILPPDEMASLLAAELAGRGFQETGDGLAREDGEIRIVVDPSTGEVTVRSESQQDVRLESKRDGYVYDEMGRRERSRAEQTLRDEAKQDIERQADLKAEELRRQVTDRLERELLDLQGELNAVANRVTAEALKQKAARLGQIKELTEDPESGSMTIVLEV
jgi:hypothetical protein